MSERDRTIITFQRPSANDSEAWKDYWKQQGQPWRIEPEIDVERQKYLARRRAIVPDIGQCIYPFKDIKLSRSDVEWLLAGHENGRGPVDWSDESQRERDGLDLRGANLCQVDLSGLPLTRLRGGLTHSEWFPNDLNEHQRNAAILFMENANVRGAQLQGADLYRARLKSADLYRAHLEGIDLRSANLEGASLRSVNLERAYLFKANLKGVHLAEANLKGTTSQWRTWRELI